MFENKKSYTLQRQRCDLSFISQMEYASFYFQEMSGQKSNTNSAEQIIGLPCMDSPCSNFVEINKGALGTILTWHWRNN